MEMIVLQSYARGEPTNPVKKMANKDQVTLSVADVMVGIPDKCKAVMFGLSSVLFITVNRGNDNVRQYSVPFYLYKS